MTDCVSDWVTWYRVSGNLVLGDWVGDWVGDFVGDWVGDWVVDGWATGGCR